MSFAIPAIPSPYIHVAVKRRKNTWYSIANGNWNDPNTWISNEKRRYSYPTQNQPANSNNFPFSGYTFPQVGDDVYINHSVTFNLPNSRWYVNNLYVAGTLIIDATANRLFIINGNIQVSGTLDMTAAVGSSPLILLGVNNYITTLVNGASSSITYGRLGNQDIMPLTYNNLNIQTDIDYFTTPSYRWVAGFTSTKSLTANTIVNGNLVLDSYNGYISNNMLFQLGVYDLTVTGSTTNRAWIYKSGAGTITFVGLFTNNGIFDVSAGNPTVECRGGFTFGINSVFGSGTGAWNFTTNNQNLTSTSNVGNYLFNGPVSIVGAITITELTGTGILQINNSINGTVAGSALVIKGIFYLNVSTWMTTGTIDYTTYSTGVIGFIFNGAYTLIASTFAGGLAIGGTGTKTLLATTTLGTLLDIKSGGTLDLSTFDLTVGTTTSNAGTLLKGSAGNILFTGQVTTSTGIFTFTGNPTVECRGGISYLGGASTFTGNTGIWTFSTNNQTIDTGTASVPDFLAPILISGAITLTFNGLGGFVTSNTVNGDNAGSTLDNRLGGNSFQYQNTQQPMLTGVLQVNAAANTWLYNKAGAQDITGGTYRTLTLAGSGAKTLQGNVVVVTLYTLTAPATLVLNGFTRT